MKLHVNEVRVNQFIAVCAVQVSNNVCCTVATMHSNYSDFRIALASKYILIRIQMHQAHDFSIIGTRDRMGKIITSQ